MVEGKKIIGACSIVDAAKAIGSKSIDVGTLCTSNQIINKWARFKPERLARRDVSPSAMSNAERKANNFGLTLPTIKTSIEEAINDANAWGYLAPVSTHYMCLTDFANHEAIDNNKIEAIGYDGNAVAPIISIMGASDDNTLKFDLGRATTTQKVYGQTGVVTSEITATEDITERTDISLGDLLKNIDGTPITNYYLAFAFGKMVDGAFVLSGWKTSESPIVSEDGRLGGAIQIDLSTDEWNSEISEEDEYVYYFVASKNANTTFNKASGKFVALPFARKELATGKIVIVKNIIPEGCVVSLSNSRIGSAPQFTLLNSSALSNYTLDNIEGGQILECADLMPNYVDFTITNNGSQVAQFIRNEWTIEASKSLTGDLPTGNIRATIYKVVSSIPNEQLTDVTEGFDIAVGASVKLRIGVEDFMMYQQGNKYALPNSVATKGVRFDIKYKGSSVANFQMQVKYNY